MVDQLESIEFNIFATCETYGRQKVIVELGIRMIEPSVKQVAREGDQQLVLFFGKTMNDI